MTYRGISPIILDMDKGITLNRIRPGRYILTAGIVDTNTEREIWIDRHDECRPNAKWWVYDVTQNAHIDSVYTYAEAKYLAIEEITE